MNFLSDRQCSSRDIEHWRHCVLSWRNIEFDDDPMFNPFILSSKSVNIKTTRKAHNALAANLIRFSWDGRIFRRRENSGTFQNMQISLVKLQKQLSSGCLYRLNSSVLIAACANVLLYSHSRWTSKWRFYITDLQIVQVFFSTFNNVFYRNCDFLPSTSSLGNDVQAWPLQTSANRVEKKFTNPWLEVEKVITGKYLDGI